MVEAPDPKRRRRSSTESLFDAANRASSSTPRLSQTPVPASVPLTTLPDEIEEAASEERISFYVQAADEMLEAVLAKEAFLFTDRELRALNRFKDLDYEARYLFVRLYLRKHGWVRESSIGYERDLSNVSVACASLCLAVDDTPRPASPQPQPQPDGPVAGPSTPRSPTPDPGVIDLTMDTDDEDLKADLSRIQSVAQEEDYSRFAVDEDELATMQPEQILAMLSKPELEELGKKMKVKTAGKNRLELTAALKETTDQKSIASFFRPSTKGKGKEDVKPKVVGFEYDAKGNKVKQNGVMMTSALQIIGPCIKLRTSYISLFDRLSLIYHRTAYTSNSSSTTSFTASLLARFGKRKYPTYEITRTFSIFPSRELLIDYEKALAMERRLEDILLEAGPKRGKMGEDRKSERDAVLQEGVKLVKEILPMWKKYCREGKKEEKDAKEDELGLLYYKKRFHPGWPLTRVISMGASVYASLGDHDSELDLLNSLLRQKTYRRGKRGKWYDRTALVLMTHPSAEEKIAVEKKHTNKAARLLKERKQKAKDICVEALSDPYTHLIYKFSLQRRIHRVESSFKVKKEEQTKFDDVLTKAESIIIIGERLDDPTTGLKSVWRGEESDDAEVSVEELALEKYQRKGWKGFHSENSILTTLWGLCFWDIIFAPVDGVFETAYQSAPLDLATDAFAIVRQPLIEKRLKAIENGHAAKYLKKADERERESRTFCVGVKWDYELEDLLEIIECLGGHALAIVFKLFCEEIGHRSGGCPDLFLWNPDDETAMFCEVKGPGDTLSETQHVWIDVLLGAGVPVEVAKVMTQESHDEMLEKAEERKAKKAEKKRKKEEESSDEE